MTVKRTLFFALMALLSWLSCAVWAGDGIPVGNAIFYPSIEAVYTHSDNIYLQDATMPYGNTSGSWWAIRPMVGWEFPFQQSYVRLDLGYQYQDYSSGYNINTHDTYTADLKGIFKFGNGHSFTIQDNFIRGLQEVSKFDPGYEQYYSNTPFNNNAFRAGLDFAVNKLNTLGVYGLYNTVSFSDVNATHQSPFFDYHQAGGGLLWKYNFRPAATFLVDVQYLENRPDQKVWDSTLYTNVNAKKYDQWQVLTGVDGDLGTMLKGYAKIGWSRLRFQDNFSDFNGFVADVGLSLKASEFFSVDFKANRTPYQSAYNINNYYTSSGAEVDLHHQVSRYIFWAAGYRYQENAYPDRTEAYPLGPMVPTTDEFLGSAGQTRSDKISRAFAELGYHFNKQFSLKANYQYEDRNSNIKYLDSYYLALRRPYSYTENRFSISAQFGW